MMVALPSPSTPTLSAIYAAYEAGRDDGFREDLGASLIGKSCERALWYDFRWTTPARFPGRILRLFESGQLEEARLVRNLRATGATVLDLDPQTGRQWQVTAHGGHFGGTIDAVAIGLKEAPKTWHVDEFKTHSAKSFRDLVAKVEQSQCPGSALPDSETNNISKIVRASRTSGGSRSNDRPAASSGRTRPPQG